MSIDSIVNSTGIKAVVNAGNYAYIQIPTDSLRGFCDGLFPALAHNPIADVTKGYMHRWVAGHDILIDVPQTFASGGIKKGFEHLGHILLTDFPTKAGIPIPLLSKGGLGEFLVNTCHISPKWLCLNAMDATVGIFAMTAPTP